MKYRCPIGGRRSRSGVSSGVRSSDGGGGDGGGGEWYCLCVNVLLGVRRWGGGCQLSLNHIPSE